MARETDEDAVGAVDDAEAWSSLLDRSSLRLLEINYTLPDQLSKYRPSRTSLTTMHLQHVEEPFEVLVDLVACCTSLRYLLVLGGHFDISARRGRIKLPPPAALDSLVIFDVYLYAEQDDILPPSRSSLSPVWLLASWFASSPACKRLAIATRNEDELLPGDDWLGLEMPMLNRIDLITDVDWEAADIVQCAKVCCLPYPVTEWH